MQEVLDNGRLALPARANKRHDRRAGWIESGGEQGQFVLPAEKVLV